MTAIQQALDERQGSVFTEIWNDNSVVILSAELDFQPGEIDSFHSMLSADEFVHAQGFGKGDLRNRFIARRALLRMLLAERMQCSPDSITLTWSPNGKPYLPNHPLRFNASSSGSMALFAFSEEHDIGLDIERIDNSLDLAPLIQSFFSETEMRILANLPQEEQRDGFFRAWTAKEACAKALGLGVSAPFRDLEVLSSSSAGPRMVEDLGAAGVTLQIRELTVVSDFAASFAKTL